MRAALRVFVFALALPAGAQELVGAVGATRIDGPGDVSHGLLLSYSHDLGAHLAASLTYLNEGHFVAHHRDGHSAQLWLRAAPSPGLAFAAGAGPYRFFDTTEAEEGGAFLNAHGWGMQYSLAATWRAPASPWFYQVRVDRIEARRGNPDATQLLAAVGYRMEQDGSFRDNATTRAFDERTREAVLYGGVTIVNSLESETTHAHSHGFEYRHAFGPVLHGALAWVNEGDAHLIRRNGVIAEAFLEPSFYRDRFSLGLGLGGYVAIDDYRAGERSPRLMTLVSSTMSYHLRRGWLARLTWHRIVSNYDRDSDIVLLGVGYRF